MPKEVLEIYLLIYISGIITWIKNIIKFTAFIGSVVAEIYRVLSKKKTNGIALNIIFQENTRFFITIY